MADTTPIRLVIADRTDLVPADSDRTPAMHWVTFSTQIGNAAKGLAPILTLHAADQLHNRTDEAHEYDWATLRDGFTDDAEALQAVADLERIGFLTRDGHNWTLRLNPPEDDQ